VGSNATTSRSGRWGVMKLCRLLVLAPLLWLCSACGGPLAQGVHAYDHGRYPEALERLYCAETDTRTWRGADRARYALYRGLVHLALGDRQATLRWLGEAKQAWDADRTLLSDEEGNRLASAWAHLPP